MLDSKGTQQQDRITLIPWFLLLLSEWLLKCFMRLCFKANQLEAVTTQCGELSSSLFSCGPCRVRLSLALLPAIKPSLPCVFSRGWLGPFPAPPTHLFCSPKLLLGQTANGQGGTSSIVAAEQVKVNLLPCGSRNGRGHAYQKFKLPAIE